MYRKQRREGQMENDDYYGMEWMVWNDVLGWMVKFSWMVGWKERMHSRDTALNRCSCNATTMHLLHHQQFNLF